LRKITVSAVQLDCTVGAREENLNKAESYVKKAVDEGASIVLLPELTPSGYTLTEEIWEFAEQCDGYSLNWLKEVSFKHDAYIGMSFIEAEGEHFYNSFYLTGPDGSIAGHYRKSRPIAIEAYLFNSGDDKGFIDTDIGRIGIGICGENLYKAKLLEYYENSVDLVIQPSSAATPMPSFPMRVKDSEGFNKMLGRIPEIFANELGVPVIFSNRCGLLKTELPGIFPAQDTSFPGLSAIADSDGTLLKQMEDEEGYLVSEIALNPSAKVKTPPKGYKSWGFKVPWYGFIWNMSQKLGERAYTKSLPREQKALSITNAS